MKRGSAARWERAPVRPILLQTSFHSAMEKGKFHKSSKDSSKRGRQVSEALSRGGERWEPGDISEGWGGAGGGARSSPRLMCAILPADARAVCHAGSQQKHQSRQ